MISLDKNIISTKISEFYGLIHRRALREPIAYIFNEKEFWSKNFEVNKDTLIPRPETELIVEKLVKIYKDKKYFNFRSWNGKWLYTDKFII